MNTLLITSEDESFIKMATLAAQESLQKSKIITACSPNDMSTKINNQTFDYVLIDYNSCPIKDHSFGIIRDSKDTKSSLLANNYGDIPPRFRCQEAVQIISLNNQSKNIKPVIKELLTKKAHLWGTGVTNVSLLKDEILCKQNETETAIYLIKNGSFCRKKDNDISIDDHIEKGQIIGELSYFQKKPKLWSVVALEDSDLIRIPFTQIDKELANLPPWVKALFFSLSSRALRYAQNMKE